MKVGAELARSKAEVFLDQEVRPGISMEVVVNLDATIEAEHCWVFFYNTREFLETGAAKFALAGNAPIFVAKDDVGVYAGRTDIPVEEQLSSAS